MSSGATSIITGPYITEFLIGLIMFLTGVLAFAKRWIDNKLKPIAKEVSNTNKQVTNNHDENFREEMTEMKNSISDLVGIVKDQNQTISHIQRMVRSQGHQLGEIKKEQHSETIDRQSLDERLRDLWKNAAREHKEIWDYIRDKDKKDD